MTGRTRRLRKAVRAHLVQISGLDQCYYRIAPAKAGTPFLVFLLEEITRDGEIGQYDLEVDISDYGTDDTMVEDLADAVQDGLDYLYYLDEKMEFRVYAETRNTVEESDKNIMRRRLTFSLRLCERR